MIEQKLQEDSADQAKRSQILNALISKDVELFLEDPLEHDMVLNMGPQHPATHGVMRLLLRLDGETVVKVVPDIGYLHRGYEKLAENMTYYEFIPHTDRLDYLSPLNNNVAFVLAVEKLAGIELPPRAQYIRTIAAELARISSHLMAVGSMAMDVGALTILLWTFREREKLYDIFDVLTGVRFTTSYTRIGGVAQDITDDCTAMIRKFVDEFPAKLLECEKLLNRNRIFIDRTSGVGFISKEDAIDIGLSGPNLRGSGVERDVRRDEPYLIYDQLDFDVIVHHDGDSWSRYLVRVDELKESAKMVRQALEKIPKGAINAFAPKEVLPRKEKIYTKMEELIYDFMLVNYGITMPIGEVYHAVEAPKGELGFYIVSNGHGYPWRLKIRSPSFVNTQALPILLRGQMVSDIVAIIGSLDPVMGDADK